jgi:hypothetical protein
MTIEETIIQAVNNAIKPLLDEIIELRKELNMNSPIQQYTIKQASQKTSHSAKVIRCAIIAGQLKASRPGKIYYINHQDLINWNDAKI